MSPKEDGDLLVLGTDEAEKSPDLFAPTEIANPPASQNKKGVPWPLGSAEPMKTAPTETDTTHLTMQQIRASNQHLQDTVNGAVEKIIPAEIHRSEVSTPIIETTAVNGIKPTADKSQNVLLEQLQRIIEQSDETGTVSIARAKDPTPSNSIRSNIHGVLVMAPTEDPAQVAAAKPVETSATTATGLLVADTEGAGKSIMRASQQTSASSHDDRQQYFNPKIAPSESGDTRQNFQDHRQGDELSQQNLSSIPQNGPSSALSSGPEQTSTFSQIVTTAQQPASQPIGEIDKPILLPSGLIVQEDEIIQQLSHRMQISGRNMDTRINLRLHPAELGSLKIDLTVKEGSIRANVVAQSQHTTEILEKNMAKLKTVLENQGYSVDEISITAESESISDFDLFDRQLFGRNDYTAKSQKTGKEKEAVFSLG